MTDPEGGDTADAAGESGGEAWGPERADAGRSAREGEAEMKKYVCDVCGWIYDPEEGDPAAGIDPGVAFEDLPDDYVCPVCGAAKEDFSPEE